MNAGLARHRLPPAARVGAAVALAAGLGVGTLAGAATAALTTCRVDGLVHAAQCGVLSRPLDPARPDSARFDLHYVVVPALARQKWPDPVFVLAGGPGQSAIRLAPALTGLLGRLGQRRDIVLVDQRGTGRSAPLDCPQPRHEPLATQLDVAQQTRALLDCLTRWKALPLVAESAGPNGLAQFTTWHAMQDLDAVRRELGAARINLVGASYGTRAALEYQRQFPAQVRRTVLDGVAPPDMVLPLSPLLDVPAALDALFHSCERAADCAAAHPSLRAQWDQLLAGLPRTATVAHPFTGHQETVTLTRAAVLGAVRGALYSPAWAAALPASLAEAAQGRFTALIGLAHRQPASTAGRLDMGMHLAVVCSEDLPRAAAALAQLRPQPAANAAATASATSEPPPAWDDGSLALYQRLCRDWPVVALPEAFYSLPRSRSPVLLLSGGLDPVTPPRHGARVALALGPMARHVVVPQTGHGTLQLPCLTEVLARFIDATSDAQALAVPADCALTVPRPPAFQPVAPSAGRAP